jgi:hypothetical protein
MGVPQDIKCHRHNSSIAMTMNGRITTAEMK